MNFFERQQRAKKNSKILIALFVLAITGVCFCVWYFFSLIMVYDTNSSGLFLSPVFIFQNVPYHFTFAVLAATLFVILGGCFYKVSQLSHGGGALIAQSLGGRQVLNRSANANETILLNIVEEISIASGVPMPPVYILKDESINAFAAGNTYDDAVIGVTKGAVNLLNRDELQGVIAHEFGHIFNGDMRLNIRAIGILNGVLFISLAGEFLLRSLPRIRISSRDKKGGAIAIIITIGLALYLIGLIGVFFGNAIKAAINRQREYLADASSVQFTRHPKGLADALKKIGGSSSVINSQKASEFSHLYFSDGIRNFFSFSTHPPLDKRIKAIQPDWDGQYITPKPIVHNNEKTRKTTEQKKEKIVKIITAAAILNEINDIGAITSEKLNTASEKIDKIPQLLHDGTADMLLAQFIIFITLLDKNENIQKLQIEIIARDFFTQNDEKISEKFENIKSEFKNTSRDMYINLIQISMPTLKTLSKEQYLKFKNTIIRLIEADKNISWFELNLKHLVLYPLDVLFGIVKIPQEIHSVIGAIKFEVEILLSAIISSQFLNEEKAKQAFGKIMKDFSTTTLRFVPSENISSILLENAYREIQKAKPLLRKKILEMIISSLKTDDDKLSNQDIETIHALCALLHLPISV
ncbi:MAG: M48 family metalloprotease [Campylobacteraceae bacterium]|jgi:Zn-dependent protease with chaperone function|nr:M48 family metalloprotease [Campylobacteraceae bacterium]